MKHKIWYVFISGVPYFLHPIAYTQQRMNPSLNHLLRKCLGHDHTRRRYLRSNLGRIVRRSHSRCRCSSSTASTANTQSLTTWRSVYVFLLLLLLFRLPLLRCTLLAPRLLRLLPALITPPPLPNPPLPPPYQQPPPRHLARDPPPLLSTRPPADRSHEQTPISGARTRPQARRQ